MSKLVAFKYAGKWKKIKVNPSAGYDQLLLHVAKSFGLDSIELNYEDPADGEVYILSSDEELEETFEQNYKWKVVPSQTSKPAWNPGAHTAELGTSFANTTITDQAESLLTQRDEYDPSLLDKKGRKF
ncbi:hypothetical protein DFJ73DRAFT_763005 [Zopfochytrium polystomum]|nr:hypothetical protein DFJ73DRAFT_763005 [Zopfochytrium polystomum]